MPFKKPINEACQEWEDTKAHIREGFSKAGCLRQFYELRNYVKANWGPGYKARPCYMLAARILDECLADGWEPSEGPLPDIAWDKVRKACPGASRSGPAAYAAMAKANLPKVSNPADDLHWVAQNLLVPIDDISPDSPPSAQAVGILEFVQQHPQGKLHFWTRMYNPKAGMPAQSEDRDKEDEEDTDGLEADLAARGASPAGD